MEQQSDFRSPKKKSTTPVVNKPFDEAMDFSQSDDESRVESKKNGGQRQTSSSSSSNSASIQKTSPPVSHILILNFSYF